MTCIVLFALNMYASEGNGYSLHNKNKQGRINDLWRLSQ
jgi:hypothetical protein